MAPIIQRLLQTGSNRGCIHAPVQIIGDDNEATIPTAFHGGEFHAAMLAGDPGNGERFGAKSAKLLLDNVGPAARQ